MEVVQEKPPEAPVEQSGPTAKEIAALEAASANQRRADIAAMAQQGEPVSLLNVAAKGRDALAEQFREHARKTAENKKAYVPPPMTERQLSNREEEMAAGRKAVERAQAQKDSRPMPKADVKEGFTTPVYRPGDVVPDPKMLAPSGFAAGTKQFNPDV